MPADTPDNFATRRIAVLGAGNMGSALVGGLVAAGHSPTALIVADPGDAARRHAGERFGVTVTADTAQALLGAELAVLAVKPQTLPSLVPELAPLLTSADAPPALLSVAAGVTTDRLARWAGDVEIYRAMPNTPAVIGAGISGAYGGSAPGPRRGLVDYVLAAVGEVVWLEREADFDALTALSGSGPAYVFALAEAMAAGGVSLGLAPALARQLAETTVAGAGRLLAGSGDDAATLRARVTSPGGTTAAALERFESLGFQAVVTAAMEAAARRSHELGTATGET